MEKFLENLQDIPREKLNVLIEHLRMGPDHLKKQLTNKQYDSFLNCASEKKDYEKIKYDSFEIRSQLITTFQSILTGIMGTWFGFAGIFGLSHGNLKTLIPVSLIAILIGSILGVYNYKLKQNEAKKAIEINKILAIQMKASNSLKDKLKHEIQINIHNITSALIRLFEEMPEDQEKIKNLNFELESHYQHLALLLHKFASEHLPKYNGGELHQPLKKDIYHALKKIQQLASQKGEWIENLSDSIKMNEEDGKKNVIEQEAEQLPPLEILIDPKLAVPKISTRIPDWFKENKWIFYLSMIPVFLGGFGSMFFYINEIPALAKEWHAFGFYQLMVHSYTHIYELIVATFVGLYFVYAFVHSRKISVQREMEIEKKYKQLNNVDIENIKENEKLMLLENLNKHLHTIVKSYYYIKNQIHY